MRKPPEKKIPHTFRLDARTLDGLRAAASDDLRSMNAAAEFALRQWLAMRAKKGPQQRAAPERVTA